MGLLGFESVVILKQSIRDEIISNKVNIIINIIVLLKKKDNEIYIEVIKVYYLYNYITKKKPLFSWKKKEYIIYFNTSLY